MALVVEDGTGKTNADSYLSITDADTYNTNHSASALWIAASEAAKEKALRLATQYLDVRYGNSWKSFRTNENQSLNWPRAYVQDNDGYYFDSNEIPKKLKDAAAELALRVINGDTLFADISKPGVISSTSVSVGPISKSVTYSGGYNQVKKYPLIDGLVKSLISSGTLERG
jgi:hypothetical protein